MRKTALIITCTAPLELFTMNFDLMPNEWQEWFDQGLIPCQESGALSCWCERCQFGNVEEDEDLVLWCDG